MSKTIQPYQTELGLAQTQLLQKNQERSRRGKTPTPAGVPSGAIILWETTTPPTGYTFTGWKIYQLDSSGNATPNFYYYMRKT